MEAHLAEDAADVSLDCPGLYEEFLCDCGVAQAPGHAGKDLELSLRQFGEEDAFLLFVATGELRDDLAGQVGLAVCDVFDRLYEVGEGVQGLFEEVRLALHIAPEELAHEFIVVECGEDHDRHLRVPFPDDVGGLDAVEAGHATIHDNDGRRELLDHCEGFLPVACEPDELYCRVGVEEHSVGLSHELVVVDHEDSDLFCRRRLGSH